MATHYHARDRTVLKNSRDGLQKENLHTKESVSISRKEKEILLNAGSERTDLSEGNVGRASGVGKRRPSIFVDGTGKRNLENTLADWTGDALQGTVVIDPIIRFGDGTSYIL